MSSPNVHWTYDDGRFSNPQSTGFPSDSDFKSVTDNFDSTFRWAATASILSAVIGAVALVAIVYAIIDCLKKAGNAIPTYARISNNESAAPASDIDAVKVTIQSDFPVISNSQIEGATMEREAKIPLRSTSLLLGFYSEREKEEREIEEEGVVKESESEWVWPEIEDLETLLNNYDSYYYQQASDQDYDENVFFNIEEFISF
ncbi:hypothetical protein FRX31_011434 [Thalictrum thalictroides]|uniref:Transmembrane protein n=1 Tax=Thalictrum thalictroides TaxID=46969 RepID=A0A7J6WNM1_THATH|nr:hypothetical protein FRX31_011434 [Thalictrum thalictroides]